MTASRPLKKSKAVDQGLVPGDYENNPLPNGEWVGVLDFRTWGERSLHVICHFTRVDDGERFALKAFRNENLYKCSPSDGSFDFEDCSRDGWSFVVKTGTDKKGKPVFLSARVIK